MFKYLKVDFRKIYPTFVVSTMSSGKSTLINSLIGESLLPSKNCACTARATAILDNDRKDDFSIHAINSENKYFYINDANAKDIEKFNDTNEISEMIIEGQIRGIKNNKKSIMIIDTPGINNSMDTSHVDITKATLDEFDTGLILYIINAEQIGTYDDNEFLKYISEKLNKNPNFKIIFAINKADSVDSSEEPLYELVANCKKYIEDAGINNPILILVSSKAALLFKKALDNQHMTETELDDFYYFYRKFKSDDFSLINYISTPEYRNMNQIIEIDGTQYTIAQIYSALCNTGVVYLESVIDETMVSSLKLKSPRVKYVKK